MAVSGLVLVAYLITHVLANLLVFDGPDRINRYAALLHGTGLALWGARLVLLFAVTVHIVAAVQLTLRSRAARPQPYAAGREAQATTIAARTIRWGGALILLFLVYHILHFTTGQAHHDFRAPVETAGGLRHFAYHNVTSAFEIGWVVLLYVVAMVFLGMHLFHGLWSMFQSLGWNHPRFNRWRNAFAVVFALVVSLGFILVPVAVWAGLIG